MYGDPASNSLAEVQSEETQGTALSDDKALKVLRTARHDFKTPLTSLRMLAQLFKMGLDKGTLLSQSERTARNCKLMLDQVDKLTVLSDILFEVSRIQGGQVSFEMQKADLRPVVQAVAAQYMGDLSDVRMPEMPVLCSIDTAKISFLLKLILSQTKKAGISLIVSPQEKEAVLILSGEFASSPGDDPLEFIASFIVQAHHGHYVGPHEGGIHRHSIRLPLI